MDFDPRDYDSRDDGRSPDRDPESRDREFDPRDAFTRDLNLLRSHERHLVQYREAGVAESDDDGEVVTLVGKKPHRLVSTLGGPFGQ